MSEYQSILSELETNFPIIDYGRRDGTYEKAEELGLTYQNGVLNCSKSHNIKEINLTSASDVLVRPGEEGLIIEVTYKSGAQDEYRVNEQGEVNLINQSQE